MMKCIRNGKLVLSDGVRDGDILIEGHRIAAIAPRLDVPPGTEVIDVTGCTVFPGFIDPHTHFQMTNALATTADDFESGTKAAVLGGTTTILNFASPEDGSLVKGLEEHQRRAEHHCSCNYKFHMELLAVDDTLMKEVREVTGRGVTSFKIYMAYAFRLRDDEIYRALSAVKPTGALVAAHCENGDLIDARVAELAAQHHMDVTAHPLSRSDVIESEAINRFTAIGELADYPVHIVHVSSKAGLEAVEEARRLGREVTCETCLQYLVLNEECYGLSGDEGLKYVMSPPLRKEEDQRALQRGLHRQIIQTLGSDHCSFDFNPQKMQGKNDFRRIPGGIPGVEERCLVAYELLVKQQHMDLVSFMKLVSENAARLYGIYPQKGTLQVGSDADITVLSDTETYIISKQNVHTAADYTPYEGIPVSSRVRHVFLNGHHAVKDGVLVNAHLGTYIP